MRLLRENSANFPHGSIFQECCQFSRPGATKLGNNQAITQPEADALEAIMQKGYEVEFALIKEAAIGNWKKFRGQFGY